MYGKEYFECGVETGKSNYQNYRWIPELTIPMAMTIIDLLEIKPNESVLDYGCAKGYLVKALRMLHRNAWGVDISDYALSKAEEDTKPYLFKPDEILNNKLSFKFCISKDVFEHIQEEKLKDILKTLNVEVLFAIIPLGENGQYVAPANNMDKTHIICQSKNWWINFFNSCGWNNIYTSMEVLGIKDSYYQLYPESHLFGIYRRMK